MTYIHTGVLFVDAGGPCTQERQSEVRGGLPPVGPLVLSSEVCNRKKLLLGGDG